VVPVRRAALVALAVATGSVLTAAALVAAGVWAFCAAIDDDPYT
jgi:hypothetical protein